MDDEHNRFPTHAELQAQIIELQSLNAELMEQVADVQAGEDQTCKALDAERQRGHDLSATLQEELALTAELQAEIARLQVVEAQNADAMMGMNDQVIDLHVKLTNETARANEMHRQRDLYIAQVRDLKQAQARAAYHVAILRKVVRALRDDVQI